MLTANESLVKILHNFLGGKTKEGEFLYTSEIYNGETGGFVPGPNLKDNQGRTDGCVARVNSNIFFIVGGITTLSVMDKALIRHEIDTGTWTELNGFTVARAGTACGHLDGELIKK